MITVGHVVAAPVTQLCYAYRLTQALREDENMDALKQHFTETRPFCNQVLKEVTTSAKHFTDVVAKFDNSK